MQMSSSFSTCGIKSTVEYWCKGKMHDARLLVDEVAYHGSIPGHHGIIPYNPAALTSLSFW